MFFLRIMYVYNVTRLKTWGPVSNCPVVSFAILFSDTNEIFEEEKKKAETVSCAVLAIIFVPSDIIRSRSNFC